MSFVKALLCTEKLDEDGTAELTQLENDDKCPETAKITIVQYTTTHHYMWKYHSLLLIT